jgi:hypothetical protein
MLITFTRWMRATSAICRKLQRDSEAEKAQAY